jgi:hypothetical protein
MLLYFCGKDVIVPLLSPSPYPTLESLDLADPASEPTELRTPDTAADAIGVARMIRFMKRCCMATSHSSSGDMRVPVSCLSSGLSTYRACLVFGLHGDARRIARVVLCASTIGIEAVHMISSSNLQESEFGDAVVWFVLHELQRGDGGGEEVAWMLGLEEFGELKERVKVEVKERTWRGETREVFLGRCQAERERRRRKDVRLENRMEEIRKGNREGRERDAGHEVDEKAVDTNKALPQTPTDSECILDGYVPTLEEQNILDANAQVYAEFLALPMRPQGGDAVPQASGVRQPIQTPSGESAPHDQSRAAPTSKNKSSLWEWLKSELK